MATFACRFSSHSSSPPPATGQPRPTSLRPTQPDSRSPPPLSSPVLAQRIKDELALVSGGGELVPQDDASTLYLPPLLSLLPEHLSAPSPSTVAPSPSTVAPSPGIRAPTSAQYTLSRLPSIDAASLSLHSALHHFRPVTKRYAVEPYAETFNWDEIQLDEEVREDEREWYIVAFRSLRRKGLKAEEAEDLYRRDREAHEEAVTHGGLISYWFGNPVPPSPPSFSPSTSASSPAGQPGGDDELVGRNLATCIWMSRASALTALKGEKHKEAARLAVRSYESYTLERYVLRKEKGEVGVRVLPWHGREVVGA
ncbi:hypothetical protein JCM10213_002182 [Rhodosporidiobolus nylandii]